MTTLNKTDIFVKAAGLREFGVYNQPLMDMWVKVSEERELQDTPICAVAALNNADTDHALLALLREYPREILEGLCHVAAAIDAEEKVLVLPEGQEALGEELAGLCAEHGVNIEYGIVNVRLYRGSAIHHFETLLALAQTVNGTYEPGTYVAVKKDGKVGDDSILGQSGDGKHVFSVFYEDHDYIEDGALKESLGKIRQEAEALRDKMMIN